MRIARMGGACDVLHTFFGRGERSIAGDNSGGRGRKGLEGGKLE